MRAHGKPRKRAARIGTAIISGTALFVAWGCTSIPAPREEISAAQSTLRRADHDHAAVHAPLEVRLAREQLQAARAALAREEYVVARWAAEKALVEAELAVAKARAAQNQEMAESIQNDIDALRDEAERASERIQ